MYRLIIADDEENIRNGMAHSLPWREWGYEVVALCASGQEVLDRMEGCRPDVVLSDIRMPGMDGVELMQRLSRDYPQVKIVILSGYSDFKYLNMSIRNHVAEYLLKPTDIDDFEETFRRLKSTMDHERLRRAQITESVLRHFHVWLTAMLGGTAAPEDTDRFLPMLTEAGIDLDNLQIAAFVLDGHGGDERPDQVALWRRVWEVVAALPGGGLHRLPFLLGGEDMVVLYSSGEEIAPADVRADIEAIQQAVRDGLRVTLSAGVSDLCTEPGMLPQAYEQANCSAKQSAFAGQEAVYFFCQMQRERPAGMPYFDTEQVEKALLAQDYEALRAEIDRVLLPLAEQLPEYRTVDQLCLSLLFHVSLPVIAVPRLPVGAAVRHPDGGGAADPRGPLHRYLPERDPGRQAGLCAGLPVRVPAGAGPPPQPQPHRQERGHAGAGIRRRRILLQRPLPRERGRLRPQDAGLYLPRVQKRAGLQLQRLSDRKADAAGRPAAGKAGGQGLPHRGPVRLCRHVQLYPGL